MNGDQYAVPDLRAQLAAAGIQVPYMNPGLNAPVHLGALSGMHGGGAVPYPPPTLAARASTFATVEQVRAIVAEEIARAHPAAPVTAVAAGFMQQIGAVLEKALSPDDLAEFQKYMANGAPGFAEMLQSDKLHPIAQLFWETVKENIK